MKKDYEKKYTTEELKEKLTSEQFEELKHRSKTNIGIIQKKDFT